MMTARKSIFVATLLLATSSYGQGVPAQPISVQTILDDAKRAADEERWPAAVALFEKAMALEPSVRTAAHLGRAQVKAGDPASGAENLQWFLEEDKQAPSGLIDAAREVLAEAKKNIATVTLRVNPADAAVRVDGKPINGNRLSWPVYLKPGAHTFVVTKEGYAPLTQSDDFAANENVRLPLALALVHANKEQNVRAEKLDRRLVVAGAITGGVFIVTGIGTAIGAKVTNDEADTARKLRCNECKGVYDEQYNASTALTAISIASLAAGTAIGGFTGLYLYWGRRASDSAGSTKISFAAAPTLGGVVVSGAW